LLSLFSSSLSSDLEITSKERVKINIDQDRRAEEGEKKRRRSKHCVAVDRRSSSKPKKSPKKKLSLTLRMSMNCLEPTLSAWTRKALS